MDIFQYHDYRDILKNELIRRTKQNPNYSQGAFARDIAISPSRLSEILSGKQGMSVKVAIGIAKGLRFNAEEQEFFGTLVECQHGRSRLARETARLRLEKFRHRRRFLPMREDLFKTLSSWYHLAILELQKLDEFQLDASWIAKQLDITVDEAAEAIRCLQKLELLKDQKSFTSVLKETSMPHGLTSKNPDGLQLQLHKMILAKVKDSLGKSQPQASSSFAVAIDSRKLNQIIPLINETIEHLLYQIDDQTLRKDRLYLLTTNFVPCSAESDAQPEPN